MAHHHHHGSHHLNTPTHQHDDEHDFHMLQPTGINTLFLTGILLNIGIVAGEAITGFWFNSLALLTDAGHNLGDVAGLVLAWLAYTVSKLKPRGRFTYGYQKTTILSAIANALILLVSVAFILYSAFKRLSHPHAVNGLYVSITSVLAIVLNAFAAWLFIKNQANDINIRGAFLHMMSDAFVSTGVLVGGLIIYFTGWNIIDPIISIVISLVIVYSTWDLLKESLNLSLDAMPRNVDINIIKQMMGQVKGVVNIHHLHIWALGTTQNALTAHVVLENGLNNNSVENIKKEIKEGLMSLHVQHATLETEFDNAPCVKPDC